MTVSVRKNGKRVAALLLALVLVLSVCPFAVHAEETEARTTEYVHLRSGPGTNYDSQGVLAEGTVLTVTDTSNSEWYAVRTSGGTTGYIFSQYIAIGGSDSGSAAKTTEYVHLRSGPGTNYSSKGVIASGTAITVTDTSNSEWYAVRLSNGTTGYMFSEYISMSGGSSSSGSDSVPSTESTAAKVTEYVNVRSGPGTNYTSKTVIASGTSITVTDRSNSEWYAVKLSNGMTGYIFSIYIELESGSSSGGGSSSSESVQARTTAGVNVRSGPGTNYTSKTVIASGTSITVTDRSNSEWYAVKLSNGMTGYIYSIYIELQSSSGSSTSGGVQAKTTAGVNLRRGAGTSFGVIRVVATGTTVTVTEATNAQGYKVKLSDGTEGYIFTEYLNVISGDIDSVKPDEDDTPDTSGAVTARTTTDINLRRGPGTTYGVIMVVDENVTVTVTEATNSEWYKVRLADGTEGYFSAQYLKIVSGDID